VRLKGNLGEGGLGVEVSPQGAGGGECMNFFLNKTLFHSFYK
jgi:hypothetical protein